jgi:hypothetical protein
MKWNFDKIENTIKKIDKMSKSFDKDIININEIKDINYSKYILQFLLIYLIYTLEDNYIIKKKEYDEFINRFSYNYLIGSEIYIGDDYSREIYLNNLEDKEKFETFFYLIIFMLYNINESKNMGTSRVEIFT